MTALPSSATRVTTVTPTTTITQTAALVSRLTAAAHRLRVAECPEGIYAAAVRLAVDNVDGADAAALVVAGPRHVEVRSATDDDSRRAGDLEGEVGEGPCRTALVADLSVRSPSLVHDTRWPRWGARVAKETGLQSLLAFRLYGQGRTVGALVVLARDRGAFDDDAHLDGLALSAHVAVAVSSAEQVGHLEQALGTRTVIGQATGILMERYGLTSDVAFATLARVSSSEEVKLRVVAERVVAGESIAGALS